MRALAQPGQRGGEDLMAGRSQQRPQPPPGMPSRPSAVDDDKRGHTRTSSRVLNMMRGLRIRGGCEPFRCPYSAPATRENVLPLKTVAIAEHSSASSPSRSSESSLMMEASGLPERPGNTTHAGCTPWRRGLVGRTIERAGGYKQDASRAC